MIKRIRIKNYILIDELDVEFDKGLNVITGETGAGKSILINAIDIAFGARCGREVIKNGEKKAVIELSLENKRHDLSKLFESNGIDNFGDEIVITKEITQTASRSRVNGTLVNQDFMKNIKDIFLDIHSQHQTYSFMQPKYHIKLLDSYAKEVYGTQLSEYKETFAQYLDCQKRLEAAKNSATATEAQIDFLKFQIKEIEDAQITEINEDELLNTELSVLENAEKLKELTGSSYWALNNDDDSIVSALGKIKFNVSKAAAMDEKLTDIEQRLVDACETLRELSSGLRDYSQNMENDTERLNEIQERLFLLDKLKRKYGSTLEEVTVSYNKLREEYEQIEFSTNNIEELVEKIAVLEVALQEKAFVISEYRKNYAEVLSAFIVEKLEKLELPKARFEISVSGCELNCDGCDKVEFLISTNVSEDLKQLAKVASGGEVSRVMLSIKSIFAQNDDIDTVIFDEIDTGISGKTSQCVAEEIKELAKFRQIILITHQAIIASKADRHFYISKTQNDTTSISVNILSGDKKINALAQLAGGDINEQSIEFARSLID